MYQIHAVDFGDLTNTIDYVKYCNRVDAVVLVIYSQNINTTRGLSNAHGGL